MAGRMPLIRRRKHPAEERTTEQIVANSLDTSGSMPG
jgi:hypothetical protein